jgi:hypothetical protein
MDLYDEYVGVSPSVVVGVGLPDATNTKMGKRPDLPIGTQPSRGSNPNSFAPLSGSTTSGADHSAILARWYQLVGEMQCLMAQMQQLGITPPMPMSFAGAQQPASGTGAGIQRSSSAPAPFVPAPTVTVGAKPAQVQGAWDSHPAERQVTPGPEEMPKPNPRRRQEDLDPAPYVALVEFKRQRIRKFDADLFVKPGSYVVVDGDRGTDCGFVVQCAVRNPDGTFGQTESIDSTPMDPFRVKSEPGRIHRLATDDEVALLHGEIARMERFALARCRERVKQMNLEMEIVDCEFQFDKKKVTFFFDSQESIDFRELNKDLFRTFGARIWLENINNRVKNVVPEGAISQAEKQQPRNAKPVSRR